MSKPDPPLIAYAVTNGACDGRAGLTVPCEQRSERQ